MHSGYSDQHVLRFTLPHFKTIGGLIFFADLPVWCDGKAAIFVPLHSHHLSIRVVELVDELRGPRANTFLQMRDELADSLLGS